MQWSCAQSMADLLKKVDPSAWLDPTRLPNAIKVKENPLRQVFSATLGDVPVFIKLYKKRSWTDRIKAFVRGPAAGEEFNTLRYANRNGIAAIQPLAYGQVTKKHQIDSILITCAVTDAVPLDTYWTRLCQQAHDPRDRSCERRLIDALAALLARAHHFGLRHMDLHSGNLIVTSRNGRPEIAFVDLQVARIGRPVSFGHAVSNLAQLNQWFTRNSTLSQRARFLVRYLDCRNELTNTRPSGYVRFRHRQMHRWIPRLEKAIDHHARQLWASRDRRVLRDGKYFARMEIASTWSGMVYLRTKHPTPYSPASQRLFTRQQWKQWLADPAALFDSNKVTILRRTRRVVISKTTIGPADEPIEVICKSVTRKAPAPLSLLQHIRPSPGRRAWQMAYMLLNRGLPVARPLAMLESRTPDGQCTSISVVESIPQAVPLDRLVRTHDDRFPSPRYRIHAAEELGRLLRRMHRLGFVHHQFKAAHIYVLFDNDVRPTLLLTDMDGIRRRKVRLEDRIDALARLNMSFQNCPGLQVSDLMRFLRTYMMRWSGVMMDLHEAWHLVAERTHQRQRLRAQRLSRLRHAGRFRIRRRWYGKTY